MNLSPTTIISLIGSIGLFLYGMKVMSDGLMGIAGDRMRQLLATLTSKRFYAILTGLLITGAIQSSSATTLMIVSFVNANLLTLTESIGVIMGANIGTTLTAWLISILGFRVNMSVIALPVVGLGVILSFSSKVVNKQSGNFLIGFGLLFIGLQFIQDFLPDLEKSPDALAFLSEMTNLGFWSILLFLVIGSLLTIIIQSSSATMALTLVLGYKGLIPLELAAAMVLGENIGTTIKANVAAIVNNFQAKRTARAHFIFNVLGVVWMIIVLRPFLNMIDWAVIHIEGHSAFTEPTALPIALSLFHTVFNLINTLFFVWWIPLIAKIAILMVPEKRQKEKRIDESQFLHPGALEYPQTALRALFEESRRLFENAAYEVIAHGINIHRSDIGSKKKLKEMLRQDEVITIDIDRIYYGQIKSIYSQIVEFAFLLQNKFPLEEHRADLVQKLLIANRYIVESVKSMSALHPNMSKFIVSDNEYIRKAYNDARRIILKVLREIVNIQQSENPEVHLKTLEKYTQKAIQADVVKSGKLYNLLREKVITIEMATSLMNDSAIVVRVIRNLVRITELLYIRRDRLLEF